MRKVSDGMQVGENSTKIAADSTAVAATVCMYTQNKQNKKITRYETKKIKKRTNYVPNANGNVRKGMPVSAHSTKLAADCFVCTHKTSKTRKTHVSKQNK
jgi:hypothetical protein